MPKVSINGQEHEFEPGLNLIEACRQVGIEIPHFCYHPALAVAGSCRMCQVEVETNGRKMLTAACNTSVSDGMAVYTDSETVKQVNQSVLEFMLLSHPLDCPICDDAGECQLQNYYMIHDRMPSRFGEPKMRKHKVVDLGPNIVLDSERCVLCSRCARFFRDVVKKDQMAVFNNGAHSEIGALPGATLKTDYTGNIVDLCPVGALTDRRFRMKRRTWYLESQDSICPGCSKGCNIEVHIDKDHNWKNPARRIQRLKPRLNLDVNSYWICDPGRYGADFVDADDRLLKALVKGDEGLLETGWEEAVKKMAAGLKKAVSGAGKAKTAVILAPKLATGATYLLKKFVDTVGIANVDYRHPSVNEGRLDDLLQMKDRNPNTFAAEIVGLLPGEGAKSFGEIIAGIKDGTIHNLLAICCDPVELMGNDKTALGKLKFFGLLHWTKVPAAQFAHGSLPLATFAETNGTYINYQGRVQRFSKAFEPVGDSKPPWQTILFIGRQMGYKFKAFSDTELFGEFTNSTDKYKGLTWDKIGSLGYQP